MKIKLKIKNKSVELSTQEAEELFNQLSEIFGRKVLEQPPYIPQPWDWDKTPTNPVPPWTITCDDIKTKTSWSFGDPINQPKAICKSWNSLEDLAWNSIGK